MSKIFIINAGKEFHHSKGKLNHAMADVADKTLTTMGHNVKITTIEDGYDIQKEIDKFVWADVIIYQQPGWWMAMPWTLKKYIDEVFTEGHGKLYLSDGRTRSDAEAKYGSGGCLIGKKYMLSLTWNAPIEAFTDKEQFFEGAGVDGVYLHFHKANQFLGLTPLATFISNDVIKNPQFNSDVERYKQHLQANFS